MQYFKKFNTLEEYYNFKNSENILLPNVSYISEEDIVMFNPSVNVGDVAYWDGNKIQTVALDDYSESMGQAIGVVVIPSNFLPDGKARIIALNQENIVSYWGSNNIDTQLLNYQWLPVTSDYGNTTNRQTNGDAYLPSDLFTDISCVTDASAYYKSIDIDRYLPSPYKDNIEGTFLNEDFIKITNSGVNTNPLSDFNGEENTNILANLGQIYEAAIFAKEYTDNISNKKWYLPACGELGIMATRLDLINKTISTVGGITVHTGYSYWSSTEYDSKYAWYLYAHDARISVYTDKGSSYYIRSFAKI